MKTERQNQLLLDLQTKYKEIYKKIYETDKKIYGTKRRKLTNLEGKPVFSIPLRILDKLALYYYNNPKAFGDISDSNGGKNLKIDLNHHDWGNPSLNVKTSSEVNSSPKDNNKKGGGPDTSSNNQKYILTVLNNEYKLKPSENGFEAEKYPNNNIYRFSVKNFFDFQIPEVTN